MSTTQATIIATMALKNAYGQSIPSCLHKTGYTLTGNDGIEHLPLFAKSGRSFDAANSFEIVARAITASRRFPLIAISENASCSCHAADSHTAWALALSVTSERDESPVTERVFKMLQTGGRASGTIARPIENLAARR